jgi:hypothetical protein
MKPMLRTHRNHNDKEISHEQRPGQQENNQKGTGENHEGKKGRQKD